jgi:hypothetical protein
VLSTGTNGSGFNNLATSVALGDNYLFSSNTVNSFRVAFNRVASDIIPPNFFTPEEVGINMYAYPASAGGGNSFALTVPGSFSFNGEGF